MREEDFHCRIINDIYKFEGNTDLLAQDNLEVADFQSAKVIPK